LALAGASVAQAQVFQTDPRLFAILVDYDTGTVLLEKNADGN